MDLDNTIADMEKAYAEYQHSYELLTDPIPEELEKYFGPDVTWSDIQKKYEEKCNDFSPAYLSGSEWYQFFGKDFRKGYLLYKIAELHKTYKFDQILAFITIYSLV